MKNNELVLLVDHDNLPGPTVPFRDILLPWFSDLQRDFEPSILDLTIRVFGGWFRDLHTTERRFEAAAYYQDTCPTALRANSHIVRINFRFADSLQLPGPSRKSFPITHTVAKRKGAVYHSQRSDWLKCKQDECQLSKVRRWFWKRSACTKRSCKQPFSAVFERDEQKQVDIHIITELLLLLVADSSPAEIGLVSSDWDMLPGLLAAAHLAHKNGTKLTSIRFSETPTYQDQALRDLGVRIIADKH